MPKPSFRCFACRRRKVKCDERVGGCLRCERYGIVCPGYPDPFDVRLRHQSSQSRNTSTQIRARHLDNAILESPSSQIFWPAIDPDEAALGAYYSAYCISSASMSPLEALRSRGNGSLFETIKILGMMHLNVIWQVVDGCHSLLRQYAKATKLLNAALADPMESKEDHTMLATLTMSVVEMKRSPDFNLAYWSAHTNGAAALVQLRGAEQVLSRIGAAMYLQSSHQIMVECLLGRRSIPRALQSLRQQMKPYVLDENHPLWSWHALMYRFTNFVADASRLTRDQEIAPLDAQATIDEAMSIDAAIDLIFDKAGPGWDYTVQAGTAFLPVVDVEHIYPSLVAARMWNDRRIAKLLLFTTLIEVADRCPAVSHIALQVDRTVQQRNAENLKENALAAIQDAAKEVLASLPQLLAGLRRKGDHGLSSLGCVPPPDRDRDTSGLWLCASASEYDEQVFIISKERESPLPYMDPAKIQWPVYFAVQCEFVEPQIRVCLLDVLENAGRSLQVQQFSILAEKVRESLPELQDGRSRERRCNSAPRDCPMEAAR